MSAKAESVITDQHLILTERVGRHVLLVTINRPDKRNAINVAASHRLAAVVREAELDDSVRAVVLTGAGGKCFSAGADLEDIANGRGNDIAIGNAGMGGFIHAQRRKPWIAAVRGAALGGGMEFALACDMVVAGESTLFGLPEVSYGLLAAAGGVFRAVRSLPRALAMELLLTAKPITATLAHTHGMINHVVADTEVLTRAILLAEAVAANAPLAVMESLAIARKAADNNEHELRAMMMAAGERLMQSTDLKEGLLAFQEKRTPSWRGR
ncbi:enoyl-CoA hydratase-related protein [Herminiimonas arsenitoxidans]|uniref:enoyl-CoA hydratase-related protein n=1 Tax=Herminiimonas arsenitoxidans TaxID=1809410 RepID=UPI0009710935|nr:enoyl-CoA hydratase-related protein [Herminiimonas arsenitoxidans]